VTYKTMSTGRSMDTSRASL